MSKDQRKKKLAIVQKNKCAISDKPLPVNTSGYNERRLKKRKDGGTPFAPKNNTQAVDPRTQMKAENQWRERDEPHKRLKALIDARNQWLNVRIKCGNQVMAYELRHTDDTMDPVFLDWASATIKDAQHHESAVVTNIEKHIIEMSKEDPFLAVCLAVPGIGPMTVAMLESYVNLEKCDHASDLWSYSGLHYAACHRYDKVTRHFQYNAPFTKGGTSEADPHENNGGRGGNKRLRCQMFCLAESMMKQQGGVNKNGRRLPLNPYRQDYDAAKAAKEQCTDPVETRLAGKPGEVFMIPWNDPRNVGHRHSHALRKVMKLVLFHYWLVGRTMRGLSTNEPWILSPHAQKKPETAGHTTFIRPEDRGWVYQSMAAAA